MKNKIIFSLIFTTTLLIASYCADDYDIPQYISDNVDTTTTTIAEKNDYNDLPPDKVYDVPIPAKEETTQTENNESTSETPTETETAPSKTPQIDDVSDIIKDIINDYNNDGFMFRMTRPLEVKLTVIRKDYVPEEWKFKKAGETNKVLVTLTDKKTGDIIFTASTSDEGYMNIVVTVNCAVKEVVLTLKQSGCMTREIEIADLSKIQTIWRDMYIAYDPTVFQVLSDADEDGIPDNFDEFPQDASLAFIQKYPPKGNYAITFEDLYPNLGDYDFNDFIAFYNIKQYLNADNKIVKMEIDTKATARGAGYNHEYYLRIKQLTESNGNFKVDYLNENGLLLSDTGIIPFQKDITLPIYKPTRDAFESDSKNFSFTNTRIEDPYFKGRTTKATITFASPTTPINLAIAPYDPYLYVKNTGYDVHLMGETPMETSKDPVELSNFKDSSGYPWALLVPIDWNHPIEYVNIKTAYPNYSLWVENQGTDYLDWYYYEVVGKTYDKYKYVVSTSGENPNTECDGNFYISANLTNNEKFSKIEITYEKIIAYYKSSSVDPAVVASYQTDSDYNMNIPSIDGQNPENIEWEYKILSENGILKWGD